MEEGACPDSAVHLVLVHALARLFVVEQDVKPKRNRGLSWRWQKSNKTGTHSSGSSPTATYRKVLHGEWFVVVLIQLKRRSRERERVCVCVCVGVCVCVRVDLGFKWKMNNNKQANKQAQKQSDTDKTTM